MLVMFIPGNFCFGAINQMNFSKTEWSSILFIDNNFKKKMRIFMSITDPFWIILLKGPIQHTPTAMPSPYDCTSLGMSTLWVDEVIPCSRRHTCTSSGQAVS